MKVFLSVCAMQSSYVSYVKFVVNNSEVKGLHILKSIALFLSGNKERVDVRCE